MILEIIGILSPLVLGGVVWLNCSSEEILEQNAPIYVTKPTEPISQLVELTLELLKSDKDWNGSDFMYHDKAGLRIFNAIDAPQLAVKGFNYNDYELNKTEKRVLANAIKSYRNRTKDSAREAAAKLVAGRLLATPVLGGPGVASDDTKYANEIKYEIRGPDRELLQGRYSRGGSDYFPRTKNLSSLEEYYYES